MTFFNYELRIKNYENEALCNLETTTDDEYERIIFYGMKIHYFCIVMTII